MRPTPRARANPLLNAALRTQPFLRASAQDHMCAQSILRFAVTNSTTKWVRVHASRLREFLQVGVVGQDARAERERAQVSQGVRAKAVANRLHARVDAAGSAQAATPFVGDGKGSRSRI